MKTAEIKLAVGPSSGSKFYMFSLRVDGFEVSQSKYHTDKEIVLSILKDHFPQFEIVDKTGE